MSLTTTRIRNCCTTGYVRRDRCWNRVPIVLVTGAARALFGFGRSSPHDRPRLRPICGSCRREPSASKIFDAGRRARFQALSINGGRRRARRHRLCRLAAYRRGERSRSSSSAPICEKAGYCPGTWRRQHRGASYSRRRRRRPLLLRSARRGRESVRTPRSAPEGEVRAVTRHPVITTTPIFFTRSIARGAFTGIA